MPKKIYVLSSEERRKLVRDGLFSSKISELHNRDIIDTLFINLEVSYPLLEEYCNSNNKSIIEIYYTKKEDEDILLHHFADIHNYTQNKPGKECFAYISERRSGDLGQLINNLKYFFSVDKIDI